MTTAVSDMKGFVLVLLEERGQSIKIDEWSDPCTHLHYSELKFTAPTGTHGLNKRTNSSVYAVMVFLTNFSLVARQAFKICFLAK